MSGTGVSARPLMGVTTGEPPSVSSPDNVASSSTSNSVSIVFEFVSVYIALSLSHSFSFSLSIYLSFSLILVLVVGIDFKKREIALLAALLGHSLPQRSAP